MALLKKILYFIASILVSIGLMISAVGAWTWVIAQPGDIITPAKWNELVTYIDAKLSASNIIGSASISVTASGSDVFISSDADGVAPYISSPSLFVPANSSVEFMVTGEYFTPATNASIPWFDGTIDSVVVTSPTQMTINLTTSTTTGDYDLVLANGSQLNSIWPLNGQDHLSIASGPDGSGPAWVYSEWFESSLWNWIDSPGVVAFTRDSWGTPSNSTWPTTWAGGSSVYIFTEASGANAPAVDFGIETDHFALIQNISFDYHMYSSSDTEMWTLRLQTLYEGVWTDRWSATWIQQVNQVDPYLSESINLSMFLVERVRFLGTTGTSFRSDMALDNIVITSI